MTVAELANLVSPTAALAPGLAAAVDGRPVRRDSSALAAGVRAGSLVTIGAVGGDRHVRVVGHQLRVVGGGDAGRVVDLARGRVRIGRSRSAELMLDDAEASRLHAEVRVTDDGIWLRDLGSSNGTRIGHHEVTTVAEPLRLETAFRVGNSSLVVSRLREPPATVSERSATLLVHRPRRPRPESGEPVEYPVAPATGRRPPISLVSALIPTTVSVGLAAALHNLQLLAFAALAPIMMVSTSASDRWTWRRQNRQARATHEQALRAAEQALTEAATAEEQRRHRDFPDAATVRETVRTVDARLFERATDDPAYLVVRLGLADRLADTHGRRAGIEVSRPVLTGVPATVSLRHGSVGIAGPQHLVRGSCRWLLAQVATLHGPSSVHLLLLAGHRADWRWLRWLPGLRQVAETPDEADELIAGVAAEYSRRVVSDAPIAAGGPPPAPWLIVVVDAPDEPGIVDRFGAAVADGWRVGISFVVLAERPGLIPKQCRTSVVYDADHPALLSINGPEGEAIPVAVADRLSLEYAEQLARGLAPVVDAGTESPTSGRATARLLDLCDLARVTPELLAARWSQQSASMTAVPVGTTTAGPMYVDLTADGPHVLIAGSTGSGKSELLRALVLSLAVSQPPDRLSMVLIDYKGGAAFAECARLPHACAVITDLDSSTVRRALVSFGAELRRREAAFARARVADLASYQDSDEAVRNPIARLVLVVDEFASLADELPGFLDGLLEIAQRGRSLGVHLILATQRPAGIVSADMRANMPLRIALRVTEPAESADVIGVDAAARISKSHPGRGFALLSGGLVEFQAARVDLPRPSEEPAVRLLDGWNRPLPATGATAEAANAESDLSVFCRTAQQAAQLRRITPATPPWLPALPETVTIADLPVVGEAIDAAPRISFGLVDEPDRQRQYPLMHELSGGGAIGFVGSPQSGRSTALRTMMTTAASALPPDALHCYVLDCASGALLGLRSLPHCGSILTKHDPASLLRLTELLSADVASRQQQISQVGASSAEEAARLGHGLPLVLVALDGWDEFSALSEEHDAGRSVAMMLAIMRDSASVGYTVLVAGQRAMFGARISAQLSRRFVFRLHDRGDYGIAGVPAAALPRSWPAGRAVIADEALEVQFALLDRDPSTPAQEARIADIATRSDGAHRLPPIQVRPLPMICPPSVPLVTGNRILLGLGGDAATAVALEVCAGSRLLVAGPPGSGRTTALRRLGAGAHQLGLHVTVMAEARSPLAEWARRHKMTLYRPHAVDADALLADRGDRRPSLLLVDDTVPLNDPVLSEQVAALVVAHPGAIALATSSDQLLTSFRGPVRELLGHRCGLLLQPTNTDRDAFGLRTGRPPAVAVPGRGVLVTDATRHRYPDGQSIQVAMS